MFKNITRKSALVALFGIVAGVSWFYWEATALADPLPKPNDILPLPHEINEKIELLAGCESGGNEKAVNPKDLDGTPSNGKFQFKVGTWLAYNEKYGTFARGEWERTLYSGYHQEFIVRQMFVDPNVNLHNEFPACSKKLKIPKRYYVNAL